MASESDYERDYERESRRMRGMAERDWRFERRNRRGRGREKIRVVVTQRMTREGEGARR